MADRRHEAQLTALEERLGIAFKNRDLLREAVTHRSYLNEHRNHAGRHNERLEFLGDAVLEIVVTEHLYRKYPDVAEGMLTNWRAALVNAERMAQISQPWRLDEALLLSHGERAASTSKARMYIHANAAEAIIGALYIDQGIGACRLLLDAFLLSSLSRIVAEARDPKSEFQEVAQERFGITPHYVVLKQDGPMHDPRFLVALHLGDDCIAQDEGSSKKEAQIAAAKRALSTINTWEGRLLKRGAACFSERRSGKVKP